MNLNGIISGVKYGVKVATYFLKRNAPTICLAGGAALMTYGAVNAAKRTPVYQEKIKEAESMPEAMAVMKDEDGEVIESTPLISKKETVKAWIKAYWPTVLIIASGLTLIFVSHTLWKRELAAITGVLAAVTAKFDSYRQRAIDIEGETFDQICMGEKTYTIKKSELLDENGEPLEEIYFGKDDPENEYRFTFGIGCNGRFASFEPDRAYNLHRLASAQDMANLRLKKDHVVLVNDVCDMVGSPRTPWGATHGWYYDPEDTNRHNIIDFGLDLQPLAGTIEGRTMDPFIEIVLHTDGEVIQYL